MVNLETPRWVLPVLPVLPVLLALLTAGPRNAAADVIITDEADEGIACFKIVTSSATYYYDKAGAGFTSMLDKDGVDWIGFRPEGTAGVPDGQSGWYRGIPNMGLNVFGHPGYTGAASATVDPKGVSLSKATITSSKGGWSVTWEFWDTHAKMTVHSAPENYWLLYEGIPGGAVGADDTCWRSSGEDNSCSGSWEGDVTNTSGAAPGHEWVFFADGVKPRSLFLVHDDDAITDRYYLMDPMTVFGFGRRAQDTQRLMSATPATLVIGFAESGDNNVVKQVIHDVVNGAPTTATSRGDCEQAIKEHRAGSKTDQQVKGTIKKYREQ